MNDVTIHGGSVGFSSARRESRPARPPTPDAYGNPTSSRSIPTGPGSRGGVYHLHRREYDRAWRAAHPEYRERERLRMRRHRDPEAIGSVAFPRPLPESARFCDCGCECREPVVTQCGFCREGLHGETA